MNDYQIIQDIGRSKHAMVYKGRKKKTIQFFALKCVDKSQKQKIMREVRFLHRLQTPYAVQFYEWFETANHLWLILELCPGNRLLDLLQADLKLPEQSVNSLALNLLAALQFLHSNGIVFNNLKPSTVLMDGSGLLKLGDFSLAMHTNTYNGPDSEESKRCKRGTPTYMAPELFRADGVCSFSSDLWSLGCVMYELASGRPPVLKSNFKALVTAIITEPYVPIMTCSQELNGLCEHLLTKGLLDRPDWETVRLHPFWEHELPFVQMPADPALEEFCERLMKEQGETSGELGEEMGGKDGMDEQGGSEAEVCRTSPATIASVAPAAARRDLGGVDLARLSQQVLVNRERTSLGSYRGQPSSDATTANHGQHDIELTGPDDEVDFEPHDDEVDPNLYPARPSLPQDKMEEGGQGQTLAGASDGDDAEEYGDVVQGNAVSTLLGRAPELPSVDVDLDDEIESHALREGEEEDAGDDHERSGTRGDRSGQADKDEAANSLRASSDDDAQEYAPATAPNEAIKGGRGEGRREDRRVAATGKTRPISAPVSTLGSRAQAASAAAEQLEASGGMISAGSGSLSEFAVAGGHRPITAFAGGGVEGTGERAQVAVTVGELLFCLSDEQVRPIVGNKKIENVAANTYDAAALPFEHALPPSLEAMASEQLDSFLLTVHRALGGKTAVSAKIVILAYVERLASSATLADAVLNCELALLMVRILRETKSVALRAKCAQTLGALVRNAAFISPDLQQAGALVALVAAVRDRDVKVRRRAMAALGELLYYVSSQAEPEPEDGVEGGGGGEEWTLPASSLSVLVRALAKGEDNVVQHYAVQALDNLTTQLKGDHSGAAARLASLRTFEVLSSLYNLMQDSKIEPLRATASSALSRIVRFQPSLGAQLVDKVGLSAVTELLGDDNARVQQAFINVLNVVLTSPSQRTLKALDQHQPQLLTAILALLDHGTSVVVRAKAVVGMRLLALVSPQWLASACDKKLFATIERLQRDKDHYLKRAVDSLVQDVAGILPGVVAALCRQLKSLRISATKNKPCAPGDALKPLKAPLSLVPLLLHVVTSPSVRMTAICATTIRGLAECVCVAEESAVPFPCSVEFRRVLHLVVEALSQQTHMLLQHHEAILAHLLPALVQVALRQDDTSSGVEAGIGRPFNAGATAGSGPGSTGGAGSTQYLCVRAVANILTAIMADRSIYDPSAMPGSGHIRQEHAAACTKMVHEVLVRQLLPKYPSLLSDKDHSLPIPQCAVRIAALVMHHNPAFGVVLQRLALVPRLVGFLSPDSPNLSVHAVCVVRAILQQAEGEGGEEGVVDEIHEMRLAERVGALVHYMVAQAAEDLYEPTLDVVSTLLYHTVSTLQDDTLSDAQHTTWLERAEPLLAVAPSLCCLCHSHEAHTLAECETASQCVLLLAHVFPAQVLSEPTQQTRPKLRPDDDTNATPAVHVAEALRMGGSTVRKRLLKTLLWVINSGDVHAVQAAVRQVEQAVGELEAEEGAIGELACDFMAALQQTTSQQSPRADEGFGDDVSDDYASDGFEDEP